MDRKRRLVAPEMGMSPSMRVRVGVGRSCEIDARRTPGKHGPDLFDFAQAPAISGDSQMTQPVTLLSGQED